MNVMGATCARVRLPCASRFATPSRTRSGRPNWVGADRGPVPNEFGRPEGPTRMISRAPSPTASYSDAGGSGVRKVESRWERLAANSQSHATSSSSNASGSEAYRLSEPATPSGPVSGSASDEA